MVDNFMLTLQCEYFFPQYLLWAFDYFNFIFYSEAWTFMKAVQRIE